MNVEQLYTVHIKLQLLPHLWKKRVICSTYCITSLTHARFPLIHLSINLPIYLTNPPIYFHLPIHPLSHLHPSAPTYQSAQPPTHPRT